MSGNIISYTYFRFNFFLSLIGIPRLWYPGFLFKNNPQVLSILKTSTWRFSSGSWRICHASREALEWKITDLCFLKSKERFYPEASCQRDHAYDNKWTRKKTKNSRGLCREQTKYVMSKFTSEGKSIWVCLWSAAAIQWRSFVLPNDKRHWRSLSPRRTLLCQIQKDYGLVCQTVEYYYKIQQTYLNERRIDKTGNWLLLGDPVTQISSDT